MARLVLILLLVGCQTIPGDFCYVYQVPNISMDNIYNLIDQGQADELLANQEYFKTKCYQ